MKLVDKTIKQYENRIAEIKQDIIGYVGGIKFSDMSLQQYAWLQEAMMDIAEYDHLIDQVESGICLACECPILSDNDDRIVCDNNCI
jgi:hypothetical protein